MKTQTAELTDRLEAMTPGRARQIPVPAEVRSLSRLSRIDYEDAFVVEAGPEHRDWSGEEWARAMIEGAPAEVRRSLRLGWTLLGLKLGPAGSPEHVLGWELEHSGEDHALLVAGSRIGMPGELMLKPEGDRLLFCTFIQQGNPLAKIVWWPVEGRHRQVVPSLMGRAARAA